MFVPFVAIIQGNQESADLGELLQNYVWYVLQATSLDNPYINKMNVSV
jgi:hypothetical protein